MLQGHMQKRIVIFFPNHTKMNFMAHWLKIKINTFVHFRAQKQKVFK